MWRLENFIIQRDHYKLTLDTFPARNFHLGGPVYYSAHLNMYYREDLKYTNHFAAWGCDEGRNQDAWYFNHYPDSAVY